MACDARGKGGGSESAARRAGWRRGLWRLREVPVRLYGFAAALRTALQDRPRSWRDDQTGGQRLRPQHQERIPLPPEGGAPSAQNRFDAASGYEGGLESSRRRQQQPRDALVAQRRWRAKWRRLWDRDAAHSD